MRGCIPGRLPLACEHLAVRPSGQAATGKTVIKQNKMNLWHGSRSTCGSHKGSPGQKARGRCSRICTKSSFRRRSMEGPVWYSSNS
ncbi:Os07g0492500 [Oryza sativa Japonica Group]|uniref:Os07g0492500 protein n=1 Tax=Oryza sativa subsp. japonica TaxID=39947 RepID=Q0D6C4_ORYSJ|nr:Os07g0492500 [Oryza sativa Japonica Group]|eukprot:NP_001059685.1 Os07g0492500 [Oryza sativa Japonica Group]